MLKRQDTLIPGSLRSRCGQQSWTIGLSSNREKKFAGKLAWGRYFRVRMLYVQDPEKENGRKSGSIWDMLCKGGPWKNWSLCGLLGGYCEIEGCGFTSSGSRLSAPPGESEVPVPKGPGSACSLPSAWLWEAEE